MNKRSMLQKYTPEGYENRGLDIEFVANVDKDIYVVRVIKVRSFIEMCAFVLGFLAGFVFVARGVKHCLGGKEYFKAKDRECDMLFGRAGIDKDDEEFRREV